MARRPEDIDGLRHLRGFVGQAETIWEFHAGSTEERDTILDALRARQVCAIVRTGLGIWLAVADGVPIGAFYQTREAAIAAVTAARRWPR
jgi:hypothetical protein